MRLLTLHRVSAPAWKEKQVCLYTMLIHMQWECVPDGLTRSCRLCTTSRRKGSESCVSLWLCQQKELQWVCFVRSPELGPCTVLRDRMVLEPETHPEPTLGAAGLCQWVLSLHRQWYHLVMLKLLHPDVLMYPSRSDVPPMQ